MNHRHRAGVPAPSTLFLCLLAAGLLWAHRAAAQSAGTAADESVVITGTRLPITPAGLAQQVTVIDQRAIQQMNPARLEDILARIAGVYVDQAGTTGGFSSLYMRGAENSHLLILLDGVKLNDPTTTRGSAYDLSSIDVSQIERIELLRGPASAVYGGEALAGVLHIITRRGVAEGLGGGGYVAAGGDRHRKIGAAVSFGVSNVQAQVSLGRSEDGSGSADAHLRLDSVNGTLRFTPRDGLEAELFGSHVQRKSEAFPDDSGGPRLAVNRAKTLRDATDSTLGLRVNALLARDLRVAATVSEFDRSEHADNAAVDAGVRFPVPAFTSDTDFKRRNATASVSYEASADASLVAGLEYQTEDGSLTSVGDFFGAGSAQTLTFALDRSTKAVFVEGRIRVWPALGVQIGLRHDKVQGLSGETTPHLGLVWDLSTASTLKFNFNEGFKPPSFFALGFPIGGNPALKPERSRNAEAIFAQRLDSAGSSMQVALFETRYRDLVDFDGNTFTNINRGTVVVRGIEPELSLAVAPGWRVQGAATLLKIDERDGLQALRNRPERTANAGLLVNVGARGSAFAGLRTSGGFLDRSNPTGDIQMPGFTVLDAAYSQQLGPVRMKLAVDNLLDKQYEQFVGFPSQGRRLRVELRASF